MTFTELSKKIATCYNSLPALVDALRDGFANVEGGGGGGSSDIEYSTEEKKIGKWINGKNLYQKTWVFDNALSVNSNTWTDTPILNADITNIANAQGYNYNGGKYGYFNVNATAESGTYVKILQTRNVASTISALTLQYTKD